jgi:hypothetical protein
VLLLSAIDGVSGVEPIRSIRAEVMMSAVNPEINYQCRLQKFRICGMSSDIVLMGRQRQGKSLLAASDAGSRMSKS